MALNSTWDELFGEAAPSRPPVAMTLAGVPSGDGQGGGQGGGGLNLKADQGPWHAAGSTSGELRTSTTASLTDLDTANEGYAAGTVGFDASSALTEILGTWKARLTAVQNECGRLEGALKSAGRDFGEREADTQRKMAAESPAPAQKKGE